MEDEESNILNMAYIKQEKDFIAQFKHLEKKQKAAVLWLMYHIGFLDLIESGQIMSAEEEAKWTKRALEDDDYILMSLIQYKKQKDQNRIKKYTQA